MSLTTLVRGRIGKDRGVDVTAKSASGWARAFAPTWDMVVRSKRGLLSWQEYAEEYQLILDRVPWYVISTLHALDRRVCLLCYCNADKRCHVDILIEYLIARFPDLFKGEDEGSSFPELKWESEDA